MPGAPIGGCRPPAQPSCRRNSARRCATVPATPRPAAMRPARSSILLAVARSGRLLDAAGAATVARPARGRSYRPARADRRRAVAGPGRPGARRRLLPQLIAQARRRRRRVRIAAAASAERAGRRCRAAPRAKAGSWRSRRCRRWSRAGRRPRARWATSTPSPRHGSTRRAGLSPADQAAIEAAAAEVGAIERAQARDRSTRLQRAPRRRLESLGRGAHSAASIR